MCKLQDQIHTHKKLHTRIIVSHEDLKKKL